MARKQTKKLTGSKTGGVQTGSPVKAIVPAGYGALLDEIKIRIRSAQIKASLAVNRQLIELYWSIGQEIVQRQHRDGWGKSIVEQLGHDIRVAFPGIAGFSARNIWRMRAFFIVWSADAADQQQPAEQSAQSILPQAVAELPWGHNVVLLEKLGDQSQRLWYAQQTTVNGWSRSMLLHWIESDLYSRQGKAITNFRKVLPAPQSDLAEQLIRDPYNFDFLTLHQDAAERDLELGLLDHIRRFLLELGAGFAFVGQQVPIDVDGEDYSIDMLFYHLKLRSFVVIDLKSKSFKPEDAGKMNFYLSAVDDLYRHSSDQPSIGLILCKTRDKVVAEYALRDLGKPIGIARYVTQLVETLPKSLQGSLPTIEELEAELSRSNMPVKPQKTQRKKHNS